MSSRIPDTLKGVVRKEFDDTCVRRFFFGPSNDPYPGTAGLFDLGPVMTAMKHNFLDQWRRHFVVHERLCELDLPAVTPEEVLVASGHVERFNDFMVRDTVTGECFRLDKYIETWCMERMQDKKTKPDDLPKLRQLHTDAGACTLQELQDAVKFFEIKSPKNNTLSEPFPFNLMFKTQIGPEGNKSGYLRPELAQGIILNFKRLIDSGHAPKMPFGAASIGTAYRNEIAPRSALIRVREFALAEIEWFLNPNDKSHPKFDTVRDIKVLAWDTNQQRDNEEATERTLGELFDAKMIDNQTLAYFMGRVSLFLERVGIKQYRFRQHRNDDKKKELAHYAQDCWDAECLTTYGWIECIGVADRSAYDLEHHMVATKKELSAREEYDKPKPVRKLERAVNKKKCAPALKSNTGAFLAAVESLSDEAALALDEKLNQGPVELQNDATGQAYTVTRELVTFQWKDAKETGYNYVPSVVEPTFGVGRLLYAILEQSYWVRKDDSGKNDKRAVFSLLPAIAAQKVAILPLMGREEMLKKVDEVVEDCQQHSLPFRTDSSSTAIGKKYARVDELGIPYAVTCDLETDGRVTLRERDSGDQVRVPIGEVVGVVEALCKPHNPLQWAAVAEKYPSQSTTAAAPEA